MKRVLLFILGIFLFVGILSVYVIASVAGDLATVKEMFRDGGEELEQRDLTSARVLTTEIEGQLSSPAARMLRVVPVVRQNLDALREVNGAAISVVEAAETLRTQLKKIEDEGAMEDDRIDHETLVSLDDPLRRQLNSIEALGKAAREHLGPLLLPPIWEGLREVDVQSSFLTADLETATSALDQLDDLIGLNQPRRYLVLLINNAELRGAGGLLTGVGTVRLDDGRISLGRFHDVHRLQDDPPQAVAAPEDYERRFSQYKAATTLWLNTTFSPDVPDVAEVAAALYKKKTGIETDGAFVIDPVAISGLLPDGWSYQLPLYEREIEADEVDDFIFSNGYSLYSDQGQRRATILKLGEQAFGAIMKQAFGPETLSELASLAAGGHIRMTSFEPAEQATLHQLGISGDISPSEEPAHQIQVTAQNFGGNNGQGTKLDHWARRSIVVRCGLRSRVACRIATSIENDAPKDLPSYVGGDGVLRNYLETYIPATAEVSSVRLNGVPVEFRLEDEEGQTSVGVFLEAERGQKKTVEVAYSAPGPDDIFRLLLQPQPLTRAAKIDAYLEVPDDWRVSGAGRALGASRRYQGSFDRALSIVALRDRASGLSRGWRALEDFWRTPIF